MTALAVLASKRSADIFKLKAQSLARIRDNQRRSRARRKEYLQELEAKLRSCDQAGIEASAEIQSAARKVLDENRRLRSLLLERGVSDADIVATLGGPKDKSYEQVSSAPALTNVLERRITSSMVPPTTSPLPPRPRPASVPCHLPSVPSLSIPVAQSAALNSRESPSPASIVSSMSTPPASYQTQLYTAPIALQVTDIEFEGAQYDQQYQPPHDPLWPSQACTHGSNPTSHYNTLPCVNNATIISTMRSDTGTNYHVGRNCAQSGQHYYSNNHVLYPITISYSQQYSRT